MKTAKTSMWLRPLGVVLSSFLLWAENPQDLNAQVVPGPDDTICTKLSTGSRDARGLVDTCLSANTQGCILNHCYVYFDIPIGAKVCFNCGAGTIVGEGSCYCAGTQFTARVSEGSCANDQGTRPCYCSYDEQTPPEDIAFYACSTAGQIW